MRTLILKIEYDGTNYSGWQYQPNAPTIQENIEMAIFKLFGEKMRVIGAGRTDAGVHSRGQIAHTIIRNGISFFERRDTCNTVTIRNALNYYLPSDIRIIDVFIFEGKFNSRYDAVGREYSYTIITGESAIERHFAHIVRFEIDFDKLNSTSNIFPGKHDFTTFSKFNSETGSYICTVEQCYWSLVNKHKFIFRIRADRFVYGMVRSLVGAMIDVARGKRTIDDIRFALDKRDRGLSSPLLPPQGLVLERVYYKDEFDFLNRW